MIDIRNPGVRCALALLLFGAASAQSGTAGRPTGLPAWVIDATVEAKGPIAGADVLVLPSPATIRALGWPDAGEGPITLEGLATGTIDFDAPPPWIEAGVAPAFAVRTRTDAKGHFRVEVPSVEGAHDSPVGDAQPRLLVRAEGYETIDQSWWSFMSGRPIRMSEQQVVRGRVVGSDGAPVPGALVCALPPGSTPTSPLDLARILPIGLLPAITVTAADGHFELVGVHFWNGRLQVARDGFVPKSTTFAPNSRPTAIVDAGTITLERGVEITGRVVDASGKPVACAVVWSSPKRLRSWGYCPELAWQPDLDDDLARRALRRADDIVAVRADAGGRFTLRGVTVAADQGAADDEALVDVQALAPDYEVGLARDVDVGHSARPDATITLARERRLELRVLDDASGLPLDDASVSALVLMWPGGWVSGSTTPARTGPGTFLVGHAGRHETALWISAPGHGPAGLSEPGLAAGETRAIEVRLAAESVLSGRVTSETGAPVAQAEITANMISVPQGWRAGRTWGELRGQTDADGRWELTGLGTGIRNLAISSSGNARISVDEVPLRPGEHRTLDFVVSRAASLSAVWPPEWKSSRSTQRWVQLVHAPPGERSDIWGQDHVDRTDFASLSAGPYTLLAQGCAPIPLQLAPGEQRDVQLVARALPTVTGTVRCAGQPVAGVRISAFRIADPLDARSPYAEGAWADDAGRFELTLPYAATWRVGTSRGQLSWFAGPVAAAWDSSVTLNIEIPDTRRTLQVVDSLGHALARATLYFADDPVPVASRITTDDDGRVELVGIAGGQRSLALIDPPVASRWPVPIELSDLGPSQPAIQRLVIPRLAAVSGTVAGEADRTPRFRVRVVRLDDPQHGEAFRDGSSDVSVTVVGGRYDLAGLQAGAYRVLLESQTGPIAMSESAMGLPPRIWWPHDTRELTLATDEQATVDFHP